mmetsp:Transcript_15605/g.43133  ORF Transcript_15605/g.43133 Transcript_15605/m.43133 type:complete len:273 (-) Transcript_15605:166-984(-)
MSVDGVEVKFLGIVQSYNEAKKFGMVSCEEATIMWGQDIYAYKDVLAAAGATVGDTIRFGIHVNPRGQPQVSLPVFKLGEDGAPIGVPPGTEFINAEEAAAQDPSFLERLKEEISNMSERQNRKRGRKDGNSSGPQRNMRPRGEGPGCWSNEAQGGWGNEGWGPGYGGGFGYGGDFGGWGGGSGQEISLFVSGVPHGVPRRELLHIFRQYAGFTSLRQIDREDHTLVFVSFATPAQAQFVADALNGYIFDEEAPPEYQTALTLHPAKSKTRQ